MQLKKYALDFIFTTMNNKTWNVTYVGEFESWFKEQKDETQKDIYAYVLVLAQTGPHLGRPYVDSIKGSKFKNMKELRVQSQGNPYRLFFIFDPMRNAVLLIGGNKKGKKKFYENMIRQADDLYEQYLRENS